MAGETLEGLLGRYAQGRPALLKNLKQLGVDTLSDRQKLATLIGKSKSGGGADTTQSMPSMLLNLRIAQEVLGGGAGVEPDDAQFATQLRPLKPLGASSPLRGESVEACRPEARVRIVALYGSGHDATAFAEWQSAAPSWLELRVLELPGHGTRAAEGLWSTGEACEEDMHLASDDELRAKVAEERSRFIGSLADELAPLLTPGTPYAFYGFSSGALFCYLLTLELARRGAPLPFRLLVCGRGAPHCEWDPFTIRTMRCADAASMQQWLFEGLGVQKESDASLVARKNALWRAPLLTAAVAVGTCAAGKDQRLAVYFGDNVRKDARVAATVQHAADAPKVPCPVIVMASATDKVWPWGLPQRWEDVAGANAFKLVEVGRLSHFAMLDALEVQRAVATEVGAAAFAQAGALA
jgi:surfactin synthase thioesterase subunit